MDAMIPWCVSVKDEQEVADDGEDIIIIKNFWRIPVDQSENGSSLIICIGQGMDVVSGAQDGLNSRLYLLSVLILIRIKEYLNTKK